MRVWIQDYYTEAHRSPERQYDLAQAFGRVGVTCVPSYEPGCDLAFCGSLFMAMAMRRTIRQRRLPSVFYNWDLYPHVVRHHPKMGWNNYLVDLEECGTVVVPNTGTAMRTGELAGRDDAVVVRAPVKLWDVPDRPRGTPDSGTYALDVMRDYKWDSGFDTPALACRKAGIELVRTQTSRPWDEFRWLVANAKCLISAVVEASTGGLTLLEGFAHGVPVVINNSALNGGGEYLGEFAHYFDRDDPVESLAGMLAGPLPTVPKDDARLYVEAAYSDDRFAADMKGVFESCLSKSASPRT